VTTGTAPAVAGTPGRTDAGSMVSRLALRRTWKGAVAVAVANVLVTVTAVIGYVAAYPDPADRVTLARSIGSNPGLTALFGETRSLETVAGFTEWRVVLVLALVGAVWAIFAVTRILRGEEDEGRAEVVLAGPITRPGATRASLLGISASTGLMLLVCVLGMTLGTGGDLGTDRALLLAVTVVSTPAAMVGVGAVTSQVAGTRRRAAGMAAAVLGASYLVRVVADSSEGLRWLRWATPLGWLELAHPLTEPHLMPILLPYVVALVLGTLAWTLVGARDTGAGLLAEAGARRARTGLLGNQLGLAVRLARGPALAWALGMGLFGMLIGLVARTAAQAMADSTGGDLLGQLGIEESGTRAYVGVSFVLITLALTSAAAGQVAATREEEAAGRLDNLLVRPVGRGRWLAGRLTASVGVLLLAAAAAVLGTWAAGSVGGLGVGVGDLAAAGVNTVPAAVFILGAGTLAHGVLPRMAVTLTYTLVAASFLLEVVGAAVALPSWLLNLSVLHHVAPAPAVSPNWSSAAVLVALGVLLAACGAAALSRRDVESA
jgi:polyether ionophore transport system permease protein